MPAVRGDRVDDGGEFLRNGAAEGAHPVGDRACGALAQATWPSSRSTPDIRVVAVNSTQCAPASSPGVRARKPKCCLGVHDDGATLRGLVGEAGQLRGVGELFGRDTGERHEGHRFTVAVGDGAGLVQQQHVDIAGGLDGPAGKGDNVLLEEAVHAGDADGRQKSGNGRWCQTDEQRHQLDVSHAETGVPWIAGPPRLTPFSRWRAG